MDLVSMTMGTLGGAVMVSFMLAFIYKRHAEDWQPLARAYGRSWRTPLKSRRFANMLLYSEGRPARGYKGVIAVGVHADGIALRPNRYLVPFHGPIFVPYGDIQGWDQDWYVDAKSMELTFSRVPASRLIMPREQVEWMLSMDPGAAQISEARPPHGTRPWATYILAMGMAAMTLVVVTILLVRGVLPVLSADLASQSIAGSAYVLSSEAAERLNGGN